MSDDAQGPETIRTGGGVQVAPGSQANEPAARRDCGLDGVCPPTATSDNDEQTGTTRVEASSHPTPVAEKISPERLEALARHVELEKLLERRKTIYSQEEKNQAWSDAADIVKHDWDEKIARWNQEIDTHLVFAGLFSAILTAFNVQSYQLLQPGSLDPTAIALQQISMQLQSFGVSSSFINSTHPAVSIHQILADAPSAVPGHAIWLNILWFSSLIIGLASTVMGILVKQWLNNYSSGLQGNSREAARLRQYRLENLSTWRVREIAGFIPVLLLISLGLFLAGLLVLLWTLHRLVAIVASVLVGVVAASTIAVHLLPFFKQGCAYVSPQTAVLLFLWRRVILPLILVPILAFVISLSFSLSCLLSVASLTCFRSRDWLKSTLESTLRQRWPHRLLSGYELSDIHLHRDHLDLGILHSAYRCTLSDEAISSAAICLLDETPEVVLEYWQRLHVTITDHFGDDHTASCSDNYHKSDLLACQAVLCATIIAVNAPNSERERQFYETMLEDGAHRLGDISCGVPEHAVRTAPEVEDEDARSAWLRLMTSWMTTAFRERPPAEQNMHNLVATFGGYTSVPEATVDLLHNEMVSCLREATTPRMARAVTIAARHDFARDYASAVHLRYLRSVDEFLAAATRGSVQTPPGSSGQAEHHANITNVRAVLRGPLQRVLCNIHRGIVSEPAHCHDRGYAPYLCSILNTLNSNHETIVPNTPSATLDPGPTAHEAYQELGYYFQAIYRSLKRQSKQHETPSDPSPALRDLRIAIDTFDAKYIGWSPADRMDTYNRYRIPGWEVSRLRRAMHALRRQTEDI